MFEILTPDSMKNETSLQESIENLKSYDWIYGKSPEMSNNLETRFNWGIIDLHFNVKEGKFTEVKLFSDSLHPDFIQGILNILFYKFFLFNLML